MPYDPNQPQNSTKLRIGPSVIRANFASIEDGDPQFKPVALNLANRTVAQLSNDPTNLPDTGILYTKTSSSGKTELFVMNPNNVSVQLTNGTPVPLTTGITALPGGLLIAWGTATVRHGNLLRITGMTQLFNVTLSVGSTTSVIPQIGVVSISGNGFNVALSKSGSFQMWYQAIGI